MNSAPQHLLTEAVREIALAEKNPVEQLKALKNGAARLAIPIRHGFIEQADVYNRLIEQAGNVGLIDDVGPQVVERTIANGIEDGLGNIFPDPTPEPAAAQPETPLTLVDWLKRDLPDPDLLLPWLSTTSRVLFAAPTGIGKTMSAIGFGMAAADGSGFLHWRGVRPTRVLFIDGEMSRRLLQRRLSDEAARLRRVPEGFHILSHEDVENFRPLNTLEGQAFIERVIERIGGVDLIIFDNIMCLLAGNMKETEQWAATLPWVRSLTRRKIGQIWMHHTNEEGKGYGDKTREWQMDTVILGEEVKRPDTDVSFQLKFLKARERDPANRRAFADARIALVNNQWISDAATTSKQKVSPLAKKFYDALVNATISNNTHKQFNCPTATLDEWRAECIKIGLLDKDKPKSASALFSKYKLELIAANNVACNETMTWLPN